ncbi:MAG: hypothetical protein Q9163_006362 [Psora crenata]
MSSLLSTRRIFLGFSVLLSLSPVTIARSLGIQKRAIEPYWDTSCRIKDNFNVMQSDFAKAFDLFWNAAAVALSDDLNDLLLKSSLFGSEPEDYIARTGTYNRLLQPPADALNIYCDPSSQDLVKIVEAYPGARLTPTSFSEKCMVDETHGATMGYMNSFKIPSQYTPEGIRAGGYMIICPAAIEGVGDFTGMKPFSEVRVKEEDSANGDLTQNWAYFFAHELSHFLIQTRGVPYQAYPALRFGRDADSYIDFGYGWDECLQVVAGEEPRKVKNHDPKPLLNADTIAIFATGRPPQYSVDLF